MNDAARAVCGDGLDTVHLRAHARSQECRTEVLASIRERIETRVAQQHTATRLASSQ